MANLIEAIQVEQNRVRELITEYRHPLMKGAGNLSAMLMELDVKKADKAIADGDVVQMLISYEALKTYQP